MKKAWIENDTVRDVAPGNPADCYHPDIALHYDTDVPEDVLPGARLVDGVWVNPASVEPPEPATKAAQVSPVEFKLLLASAERLAIATARATNPVIDDWFSIIEDPRLTFVDLGLRSTRDAIGYLAEQGLISAERVEQILAGTLQ